MASRPKFALRFGLMSVRSHRSPARHFYQTGKNSPQSNLIMSPSPARRNGEPPPLLMEEIKNAKKTHQNVESMSGVDIEMDTDEAIDYSKRFLGMMEELAERINSIEKKVN
ncbi:hypothetical protein O181_020602 [Austropuccinia psidii MF-1]|uniref:Uncharacterized protein n=1 Tax=Austropuccinia psidii MF-1 TaxID=1389203 RepID=A0A9Q3CDT3_9BASI|nr:hypothetical protein [Austropuccinia psidii MF-1]